MPFLNNIIVKGLSEDFLYEQRNGLSEGESCVNSWGVNIYDRIGECKDP